MKLTVGKKGKGKATRSAKKVSLQLNLHYIHSSKLGNCNILKLNKKIKLNHKLNQIKSQMKSN